MVALVVAIAVGVGFVVAFELAGAVRAWRHDRLLAWPVALPGGTTPVTVPSSAAGEGDAPQATTSSTGFEELFAEVLGSTLTAPAADASARQGPSPTGRRTRRLEAEPDTDLVLQALIERVASSRRDVARAVSAFLREGHAELALFGADVPARPGRLSGFADLSDVERRRVIIRVLCLLLAQDAHDPEDSAAEPGVPHDGGSESGAVIDLRLEHLPVLDLAAPASVTPAAAGQWADVVGTDEKPSLPQRRRLVRSAR